MYKIVPTHVFDIILLYFSDNFTQNTAFSLLNYERENTRDTHQNNIFAFIVHKCVCAKDFVE